VLPTADSIDQSKTLILRQLESEKRHEAKLLDFDYMLKNEKQTNSLPKGTINLGQTKTGEKLLEENLAVFSHMGI